jgi:hypothetical protein
MRAGIADPRAKALARDSARNLAVLRRLIPGAPGGLPKWAEEPPPHALLAALLAGGWDEHAEADRTRLSELADQPYDAVIAALARYVGQFDSPLQKIGSTWRYDAVIAALAPYVGQFDSPLQKIGSTWRVASPSDAWFLLTEQSAHCSPLWPRRGWSVRR